MKVLYKMASGTITSFNDLKRNFKNGNTSDLRVSVYTTFPKHDGNEYSTHYDTQPLMLGTFTLDSEVDIEIKVHGSGNNKTEAFLADYINTRTADYINTRTATRQQGFLFRLNADDIGWYQTYNSKNAALSTYEPSIYEIFAQRGKTPSRAGDIISEYITGHTDSTIGNIRRIKPAKSASKLSKRGPKGGKKCTTKSRRNKSKHNKSRRNKSKK
jgi:hypothetical protein